MLLASLLLTAATTSANENWCQYSKRTLILFVDRTTVYDKKDRENFAKGLEGIFEKLTPGDRFVVQTIEDTPQNSKTVFEGCYPGCPKGGMWSWLSGSCREMKARASALKFKHDLARRGKTLLRQPAQFAYSAIGETLGTKALDHQGRQRPLTDLFAFTDLLENTLETPWPSILVRDGTSYVRDRELADTMTGVKVVVFGIGRSHGTDRSMLDRTTIKQISGFWTDAFQAMGARNVTITTQFRPDK